MTCIVNNIYSVEYWNDLEMRVMGRSRSLEMAPFDRSHCNFGCILYRFRNKASYWWEKTPTVRTPFHLGRPTGGTATRVFFRIWNMGGVNQPLGVPSLPFSSPFPFPLPPLPLSPSFPPEAGGCCAKVGGGGVGNSLTAT